MPLNCILNEIKLEEVEHLRILIKLNTTIEKFERKINEAKVQYEQFIKEKEEV